jgi:DNA-binding MarR family transcriptional regulator
LKRAASFPIALRSFLRRIEDAVAVAELSPQRSHLLLMIRASPTPATIGDLRRLLQVPQGAMSELVRRTEAAGLIRRERSHTDGRVFLFFLTAEGERRVTTAFTALRDARDHVLHDLAELDLRLRAALTDPQPSELTGAATVTPLTVELADWRSRATR